jgi:hypothetical protein|tara:strand:- start:811 stop:1182 length:372 start_codon:yes stop_codon:yes gene_type:complete
MSKFEGKEVAENYVKGLELTLKEFHPRINTQADGLSTKQLRRVFKSCVQFSSERVDNRDLKELERLETLDNNSVEYKKLKNEYDTIGSFISMIEAGVQYTIHIVGQLQQEQNNVEKTKGEFNE